MSVQLNEPQARVLAAVRDGATLMMHTRGERGPFYTLNGRRVSVTLLKELQAGRWIAREGGADRATASYSLTPEGLSALAAWEAAP